MVDFFGFQWELVFCLYIQGEFLWILLQQIEEVIFYLDDVFGFIIGYV